MLSKNAREFVQIMQNAAALIQDVAHKRGEYDADDLMSLDLNVRHLKLLCRDMRLPTSLRVLEAMTFRTGSDIVTNLHAFMTTFHAELDARRIYFPTSKWAHLYEEIDPLFGEAVDRAYPSARQELREAGKCLALDRNTAAVMHLMRAVEVPFKLLCEAVGLTFSHENAEKLLNDVRGKINAMVSAADKPADWKEHRQFYAEVEAQLRSFKDAWRNYAMHLHASYDEERASEIWHAVQAFMKRTAGRLKETG